MADISTFEKEAIQFMDACSNDLKKLKKKDAPSQRIKQISIVQNKIAEIKIKIESYELEILQLDRLAQAGYKESLKNVQSRFKELKNELAAKKAENTAEDPKNQNPLTEGLLSKKFGDMDDVELVKIGEEYQAKQKDAAGRILANIENANDKADAINLELQKQGEGIQKATEKARDVQSQTAIAVRYVKYFAKTIYTDKILMCLIFLCTAAVIAIVVIKVTKKSSTTTITTS